MRLLLFISLFLFSWSLVGQSWIQMANAPIARHHPISFSLNGKGYAVTGSTSSSGQTDDVVEYDPITNSWNTLAKFPGTARSFGIGVVTNGLAYLGFGATSVQYLKDLWSFDATTGTWTQLASCPCSGRRHPAMVAIGNKIYLGLGDNSSGDLNDWWVYNITTNAWTQIANLPGPARHHPYMFRAGNDVFAGFGHSGSTIYKDWYKLDTTLNAWTTMSVFQGEARVAGTQFDWNGMGYVLSGDGDDHSFMQTGELWSYNHTNDSWSQLTPHPGESRWAPGSFVINNEVYFFGGYNRFTGQYPNDLWKFALGSPTGIEENSLATTVYPNPAKNEIYWDGDVNISSVTIYNSLGQLVLEEENISNSIQVKDLDNGLYFVHLYDSSALVKKTKVLIQH